MACHLMQAKRARITHLILADEGNSWKPEAEIVKDIMDYFVKNVGLEKDEYKKNSTIIQFCSLTGWWTGFVAL